MRARSDCQLSTFVRNIYILIVLLFLFSSCSNNKVNVPTDIQRVLNNAGKNKNELQKVIDHYAYKADSLKLRAAFFLIRNMPGHYSYKGKSLDAFNKIFEQISEYERITPFRGNYQFPETDRWADSIVQIYGSPDLQTLKILPDQQVISAKLLIENIELAFKAWRYPWSRHLNFNDFCEYVLPYRFQDEQLEAWRAAYAKKFSWLPDSMKGSDDPVKACNFINNDIKKWFRFNEVFYRYPSAISSTNLLKARMGKCLDQAGIVNFAMRAMGIAVVHESIPQWGNRSMGHDFSAVMDKKGTFISFLGGELAPGKNELRGKAAKIYREMFSRQNLSPKNESNLSDNYNPFEVDVTRDYIPVTNISIDLPVNKLNQSAIYLAVFDDVEWVPVAIARNFDGKIEFKNVGIGNIYLLYKYVDGVAVPVCSPILAGKAENGFITPNFREKETVSLTRKYPLNGLKLWWLTLMGKGRFQGANKSDFSDGIALYQIPDTITMKYHTSQVIKLDKYRYVRYLFPDNCFGSLGEIAFYGPNSKIPLKGLPIKANGVNLKDLNIAFDGKLDQFIHTDKKDDYNNLWIGLDLGKKHIITRVGYSPRNDQNNVERGMLYELFYWNNRWMSLGKKTAKSDDGIAYNNVPSKALLLLRNLTEGKEERIFLYDKGKQVWY